MNGRRKFAMLMLVAAIGAMGFMPAHAAGKRAVCVTNATVTLDNNENLAFVDGGAGGLSGTIQCQGDLAGSTGLSGPFTFCPHTNLSPHVHPKCVLDPSDEAITEPIYDAGATVGASQVIAHVNGVISFTLGTVGCSFSLLGHTVGTVAELQMKNFKCGTNGIVFGGPSGAATARSQALSEIIFNTTPCPHGDPQLCFQQLAFQGISEIAE